MVARHDDDERRMRARIRVLEVQLWAGREELRLRGHVFPEAARSDMESEMSRLESDVECLRARLGSLE